MADVECCYCGCNAVKLVHRFGSSRQYECDHCGKMTIAGGRIKLPVVEYRHTACHFCESLNTKIVRGPHSDADGSRKRHHVCNDCGGKFASNDKTKLWRGFDYEQQ